MLDSYKGELVFKGCWKIIYLVFYVLNVGKFYFFLKVYGDFLISFFFENKNFV